MLNARFKALCAACGKSMIPGQPIDVHPKSTGTYVHGDCMGVPANDPAFMYRLTIAQRVKAARLSVTQLRTVGKALGARVTLDGKFLDYHDMLANVCQAALGRVNEFEAAFALATKSGIVTSSEPEKITPPTPPIDIEKAVREFKADMGRMIEEGIERRMSSIRRIEVVTAGKAKKVKGTAPKVFERLVQLASQRVNVLMVGPSGCGKTYVASMIAETLGLEFASISCSVGMSESQLAGWLLPTGRGGKFEYKASQFIEVYEHGGVFLFDEIDAADPNTMTFVNAALSNGHMFVSQKLDGQRVDRHPDCVILAAANTYGNGADMQYVGRNQLDAATMDRFRAGVVAMDYDEAVERSVSDPEVYAWAMSIRTQIKKHGLRRVMSTRTMRDFSKMKTAYAWQRTDWEASYFADWSEDDRKGITNN